MKRRWGSGVPSVLRECMNTLLGNTMAGLFMTGKNIDRENYVGIFENPPLFSCDFCLMKIFGISTYFQRISEKFWTNFISIKILTNMLFNIYKINH